MAEKKKMTYEEVEKKCAEASAAKLAAVKKALADKATTRDAFTKLLLELNKEVMAWNQAVRNLAFSKFMATENPICAAIAQFYITSRRVKEVIDKETGETTDVVIKINDETRFDPEEFVEFGKLDKQWLNDCDDLLYLLQLRKTDIYAMKPSELALTPEGFKKVVRKKKEGETPDSNTQVTKLLQKIVDETIVNHKSTVKDIIFIEDAVYQFDPKQKAGIRSLKARGFKTVMVSVLYSILMNEPYTVKNFKIKK